MCLFLVLVFVKGVKTKVKKKSQKLLKKAAYFSSDSKLWTRRSWTSSSSLIPAGDNLLLVPEIRENFMSNLSVCGILGLKVRKFQNEYTYEVPKY